MTLLSVQNLTVSLPSGGDRDDAVSDVSFTVRRGEVLCIVGESGSGKSVATLAISRLLSSALKVSAGRIELDGQSILDLSVEEMRRLRGTGIGMIFQEPMTALNPLMTVGDQIAEVFSEHDLPPKDKVAKLLAAVELPSPELIAKAYPHTLSGGQRQRVMIAMALALEPDLLIADEPTTALDVTTQRQILALIRKLQAERGMGVLFITHDFGVVAEIAHRVIVMQRGRIVEEGRVESVLRRPSHPYTRTLIDAIPSIEPRQHPSQTGSVILDVRGLCKKYGGGRLWKKARAVEALKDASFQLSRGETIGILGESGSGKSTLARALVGLVKPDSGAVDFDGVDLAPLGRREWKPFRKRIQMVFQDPYASLNPRRQVGELIMEGPLLLGVGRAIAEAKARELLSLVQLNESAMQRYPHEFSGGQRQRIGIARALAVEPDLLIADEPVSALDLSVQARVLELLASLRKTLSLTMVFITHDLRVAAQVCDRVVIMRRGEVVESGATAEVFTSPRHDYTKILLESLPGRHLLSGRDLAVAS